MFALGPPTSWITPLNAGIRAIRSASRTIESAVRDWTALPWWEEMAQNAQSPKQPRWVVIENRTGSSAGTVSPYDGCCRRGYGSW